MYTAATVLHVDDDTAFRDLTRAFLSREAPSLSIVSVDRAEAALTALEEHSVDCIVSDYDMPGTDGLEFLRQVRDEHPDLPFILFTGKGSEQVASEAISAGVTEYLQKGGQSDRFTLLANRIDNLVEKHQAESRANRMVRALEAAHEGIGLLDEDGHFTYVNDVYADIYGYDAEELLGEHWELLYPEAHVEKMYEEVLPVLRETGTWAGETTGVRKDGSTFPEQHSLADTDEGGLICVVRDATQQKERERTVATEQALTEAALDALDDLFYVFAPDGTPLRWNDRFNEVTGYSDEEIESMSPTAFIAPEDIDQAVPLTMKALEKGTYAIVADLLTKSGERIPYEFTATRIETDAGEPVGIVGIGRRRD